jgi:hypothetical protein
MRLPFPLLSLVFTVAVSAQEAALTPSEELRVTVREWVETMRKVQQEENDWSRDEEVLRNYKEGLEKEIADLKQRIADAKTRKTGADRETMEQGTERDRLASAKDELAGIVRRLEENLSAKLGLLPASLLAEPKVAQGVEDLRAALKLPAARRNEGVPKRLLNVINLLTEAEKFQQVVHLRTELHKNREGREFNMKVIYFGLACAYAVNEDGSFALAGRPTASGWLFEEKPELAREIARLIAATSGDQDAAFVNLPLSKP